MKIVYKGTPPAEWKGKCGWCKTVAEATKDELIFVNPDAGEDFWGANCPVCQRQMEFVEKPYYAAKFKGEK